MTIFRLIKIIINVGLVIGVATMFVTKKCARDKDIYSGTWKTSCLANKATNDSTTISLEIDVEELKYEARQFVDSNCKAEVKTEQETSKGNLIETGSDFKIYSVKNGSERLFLVSKIQNDKLQVMAALTLEQAKNLGQNTFIPSWEFTKNN